MYHAMAGRRTKVRLESLGRYDPDPGLSAPRNSLGWRRHDVVERVASSPTLLGLLASIVSGAFALVHLFVGAKGNLSAFILVGAAHAHPAQLPHGITVYAPGYDGMYYYRLALDPLQWRHTAFGITFDSSYRIVRIAYPALAWLFAAGHRGLAPATLVVVNVVAFGVLTGCACALAREARRRPAWGLLIPAYWGYLWTISRDLTELVAAAALVGAMLAIRRDRPVVAALCLTVGVLGRETVLVFIAAVGLARVVAWFRAGSGRTTALSGRALGDLAHGGPGRSDLVWLVPALAFVGWEIAVRQRIADFPVLESVSTNRGVPFVGIAQGFSHYLAQFPDHAALAWFVEFAVLALVVVSALVVFPTTRALLHERLAWIGFVALSVSLSNQIWLGDVGFRSLDEVFVLSVVLLLFSPRRLRLPAAASGLTWLAVFVQLARVV